MSYSNEYWDSIQTRAVDPFKSYEAEVVNRLTRVFTLGRNLILQGADVIKEDTLKVKIFPGKFVKDDAYIQIDEEVILDFMVPTNYVLNNGIVLNSPTNEYWIVMEYVWAESLPAHRARYKIARRPEEITGWHIILKKVTICQDPNTNEFYICGLEDDGRLHYILTSKLIFDSLKVIPHVTDKSKVQVLAGYYYNCQHNKPIYYTGGELGPFDPVSASGKHRYDFIVMDMSTNQPVILHGPELNQMGNPYEDIPSLADNYMALGIVYINEDGSAQFPIEILENDIYEAREFLNCGTGGSGVISAPKFKIHTPPDDSFDIREFTFVNLEDPSKLIHYRGGVTPQFNPVSQAGNVRFDLLVIDNYLNLSIIEGIEYQYTGNEDPFQLMPLIPDNKYSLFIVKITEDSNVQITFDDITVATEDITKGDGFSLLPKVTPNGGDTVKVSKFLYVSPIYNNVFRKYNGGISPQFNPVSDATKDRYDLLVIDDLKQLHIIEGTEQEPQATDTPYSRCPVIPSEMMSIAIIHITEDSNVDIIYEDITLAMESLNKSFASNVKRVKNDWDGSSNVWELDFDIDLSQPVFIWLNGNLLKDDSSEYQIVAQNKIIFTNNPPANSYTQLLASKVFRQPNGGFQTSPVQIVFNDWESTNSNVWTLPIAINTELPVSLSADGVDLSAPEDFRFLSETTIEFEVKPTHITKLIAYPTLNGTYNVSVENGYKEFLKTDWDGTETLWDLPINIDPTQPKLLFIDEKRALLSDYQFVDANTIQFFTPPQHETQLVIYMLSAVTVNPVDETVKIANARVLKNRTDLVNGELLRLPFDYDMGIHQLDVRINGLPLVEGVDYEEYDTNTIKFLQSGLDMLQSDNDLIIVRKPYIIRTN